AARRFLAANLRAVRAEAATPELRFFAAQGLGFFRYYSGKLALARRSAEAALNYATQAELLYGKVLSSDLFGHTLVLLGEVSAGISALRRALAWSRLLGDGGIKDALEIS